MPIVQIQKGLTPCQVDDFGADVERSAKGALFLRPSSTKALTAGELEHLKKNHPEIWRRLVVVPEKKAVKKPAAAATKPVVEAVKPAEVVKPSETSESSSSGRSRRRSDG